MINPAKLLKMRSEATAMQRKMQEKKILGESRSGRLKLLMNAAQEIEQIEIDEAVVDESTLKLINNELKEAFKDYQKKLQKEMAKDLDMDQLKKFFN
ncbi:YbaB/EbfC family nucleoid-associated protein [Candidatus Dojkabacteria bacterium]|jgi:DNA-binding protein YbaB|nr:YbaB/EbfC family nucleoid-associated protein [Candidatus Dojkabacteria bacterium]